ncbi:hypothetical protein I7I53_08062 [Histoplasma capsulatum var. duboisii H88]|uniref:Uncharacterized protein n=1 Tax=Ajellomyces capsulatus (strain H88) TaxID=544711 RepID=A0A8A1LIF5_AJEC8|nr:hypothetical protein I7I53_08062 [Histoplasma capsulatum var. duboisii H88]
MPQHSAQPEKYIQQVLLTIQFIGWGNVF